VDGRAVVVISPYIMNHFQFPYSSSLAYSYLMKELDAYSNNIPLHDSLRSYITLATSYILPCIQFLGQESWKILFITTFVLLFHYEKSLFVVPFVVFFVFSVFLNWFVKQWIREPRPRKLSAEYGDDRYGMPSGHANHVFFCLVFLYLVKPISALLFLYILITFCMLYQRYTSKRHTLTQLFFGACFGSAVAFLAYRIAIHRRETFPTYPIFDKVFVFNKIFV
jgi:membrane-associated phospholipid phosphatase